MRALALWLSGYDKSLSDAAQLSLIDRGHMELVGSGVGLSGVVATASGALASTWVTDGQPLAMQIAIAGVTGVALAAFMVLMDRAIIVSTDHRPTGQSKRWVWFVRIGIVLAVSASTVLKLAPSFVGSALAAQAADERERRDAERSASLAKQFDVKGLSDSNAAAAARIEALRHEMVVVPDNIGRAFAEASNCFGRISAIRGRLVESGMSQRNAMMRTAGETGVCTGIRRRAEAQLAAHRAELHTDLEAQRQNATALHAQQIVATAAIGERVTDGKNSDRQTITQTNLTMLTKLITNDPTAMAELLALWVVLVLADGAGLIIKAAMDRTEAGERIGVEHGIAKLDADTRFIVATLDQQESIAMRRALGRAMIDALDSVEARDAFNRAFANIANTIAPLAAAALGAKEAEEHAASVERSMRRSPRLAGLMAKLMADALDLATRHSTGTR